MTAVLPFMQHPIAASKHLIIKEAIDNARGIEEKIVKDATAEILEKKKQLEVLEKQNKRYLSLRILQLKQAIQELEAKTVKTSATAFQTRFEQTAARFEGAISKAGVSNRMVSTSLHSTSRQLKRANVVLMAPENSEECLRQSMRAELGLQETPLLLTPGDVCDECGVQMSVVSNDSMLSCPQCHKLRVLPNMMTTSALNGGDVETSSNITKHRLPEWIEMAGAEEFAEPSDDLCEEVARFMVNHKMTGLEPFADIIAEERSARGAFLGVSDAVERLNEKIPNLPSKLKTITSNSTRIALKGLVTDGHVKFRKLYERSAKICSLVCGFWPPRMNTQQKETLRLLYTTAAPFYEKRRKPKQTYWPGGFPFFLRCACVLLGWDEFAPQFPIPAGSKEGGSRDNLRTEIWNELGWEVVPYTGRPKPLLLPDGTKWSGDLDDDGDEDEEMEDTGKAREDTAKSVKQVRKDVESKIGIKKRRRVNFELECA